MYKLDYTDEAKLDMQRLKHHPSPGSVPCGG